MYLVCFSHVGCRGIQLDPVEQAHNTYNQNQELKVRLGLWSERAKAYAKSIDLQISKGKSEPYSKESEDPTSDRK